MLEGRQSVVAAAVLAVGWFVVTNLRAEELPALADSDPSQWQHIALARANEAASAVDDPYRLAEVLAAIARAQIDVDGTSAGDRAIHQALAAAARIDTAEFRGWVLHDIALAQIAADDLIGAKQTADAIVAVRPQSSVLGTIATIHSRAGDVAAAQALVQRIRDKVARSEAIRQIVVKLSADGDIAAASQLLPTIDDDYYSAVAHGDVAVALVKKGDTAGANAIASKARRASRNEVNARIALARAQAGDIVGARQSLQKIDAAPARAMAQGRIALQRVDAADLSTARGLLTNALSELQQSKARPQEKLLPSAQLARWLLLAGDRDVARETLRRVREEANQLPAGRERDDLLEYIGRSQARSGDTADAIDAAKNMSDRVARALLVRDAVSLQPDVTKAVATEWTVGFDDPLIGAAAQFGLLSLQSLRTGHPLSLATIDAARKAVQRIDDRELQPAAFAALAAARVRAGDIAGSRSIYEEALSSAAALPRAEQRAAAYVRIVNALDERLMFLGRPAGARSDETQ